MSQSITSITRGPRQSNFELLRIIAMFMVLTVHADFSTFGVPTPEEIANSPWSSFGRIFVESAAVMGVNIFIMISGWFGIKPTIKGFCNFAFQVLYFFILSWIVTIICGIHNFAISDFADFMCFRSNWFIVSYAILYAISPILNTYIETANKKTQLHVLICFYILQTFYGFISLTPNFNAGYSTFSFIGLYLLSAYARRNWADIRARYGGVIYWFTIACIISVIIIALPRATDRMLAYSCPLVIMATVALILQFNQLKLGSHKTINFIATSAFGVYLLHANKFMFLTCYIPLIKYIGTTWGVLAILGTMISVFIIAIVIDQPRKWLWKLVSSRIRF